MTKTRDIADLLDANGDVKLGALDNVPASNDASALTTGTLAGARLPDPLPAIDGSSLTGIAAFPSGTLMLFQQTAAPTGWTKQTTHNDKALRVVSGTAGTGGSSAFSTALATPALSGSTGSTTLSTSQIPSHIHTIGYSQQSGGPTANSGSTRHGSFSSDATGGGGSHNHTMSGTAAINVQYVDVIIASKD